MRARYGSADYRAAQGVMRDVLVRLLAEQYDDEHGRHRVPGRPGVGRGGHRGAPRGGRPGPGGCSPTARLLALPGVGHLTPTEAPASSAGWSSAGRCPDPGRRRPAMAGSWALLPHLDGRGLVRPVPPRRGLGHRRLLCGGLRAGRPALAPGGPARALPGRIGAPGSPVAGGARRRQSGLGRRGRGGGRAVGGLAGRRGGGRRGGRRRPARSVPAGPDLAPGLDPPPPDAGRGVGGPRGGRRGGRAGCRVWPRRPPWWPRWPSRCWSTWPAR